MKYCIVAHTDVDGMASAAILLRRYPHSKLVFAEPHDIEEKISSLLRTYGGGHMIVCDIPHHAEGVETIDHHPDLAPSNTYLMKEWPEATAYLVKLGLAAERRDQGVDHDMERGASVLRKAIDFDADDDAFRKNMVLGLAKGKKVRDLPEYPELRIRALTWEMKFNEFLSVASQKLEPSGIVLYPDLMHGYAGAVASNLADRCGDAFLIRGESKYTLIVARCNKRSALDVFDELARIDPLVIPGKHGGHARAAAYRTKSSPQDIRLLLGKILIGAHNA